MTDVELDQDGRVVAARHIKKGEIIAVPVELYERMTRKPAKADERTYEPGEVMPDGRIMTAPVGGHAGYPADRGVIYVTPDQADAAERYGWERIAGSEADGRVQVAR